VIIGSATSITLAGRVNILLEVETVFHYRKLRKLIIGHFQVALSLSMKARPTAQPVI